MNSIDRAHGHLNAVFGFSEFREGQSAVVGALLEGRPALAIFPTGGGKSLCYQLPALQLDGVTLVVSPLIALMKDQVDHLLSLNVPAARLDSSLTTEEVRDIYERMADGTLKLLYVAPERLSNEGFRNRLRRTRIAMLAIDEAHCISEWGHNFRPDYLKIAAFTSELGVKRVLALTATATPEVAKAVRSVFGIEERDHVQTGFHRPNLTLRVHACTTEDRVRRLVERVVETAGAVIVYVTLQNTAETVAKVLASAGVSVDAYHAGMKPDRRSSVQDAFMSGATRVIVATIAFGMGIDKADIRAVFHFNLPKSLESYSQEIGRAGRDGAAARCEVFAVADDQAVLDNFSYGDTPTREALAGFVHELFSSGEVFDVARQQLSKRHDIRPLVVATVLTYLELQGLLESTGPFYAGYKLKFLQSKTFILDQFDDARSRYLEQLFSAGKMGRIWLTLDPDEIASIPREKLLATLGYLEQKQWIVVRPSGLRHGYKRLGPVEEPDVVEALVERFQSREASDIARTASVLAFCEHKGCLTQRLVSYFGEAIDDCGHCGPCLGESGGRLPRTAQKAWGPEEDALLMEGLAISGAAVSHPRARTRFLCGLRSPATQGRDGLQRHPRFGCLSQWPFLSVLERVQRQVVHRDGGARTLPPGDQA